MRLYQALTAERFRVFTTVELCCALGVRSAALDELADALRARIAAATGLRMVQAIWGIGSRLEHLRPDDDPHANAAP